MIVQYVPITQPPSTLCMYIGNFMPEIHSCIIRIISKVFNIRECEKQRSLILFLIRGRNLTEEADISQTNSYQGFRLSWAKSYQG